MLPGGIREAIRRKHEKYVLKLAGRKGLRGAEDWAPELQSVVRAALEKKFAVLFAERDRDRGRTLWRARNGIATVVSQPGPILVGARRRYPHRQDFAVLSPGRSWLI
ncbi:hypothetical protein IFM12275_07950 [Nocardia sputorum]|nr:hypothetical protein IFM12275_07950 [Nocardia sputorum]